MIVFMIILSLILESLVSNIVPLGSVFTPLFSIVSLVLIYPFFNNNDLRYIKYCGITGLIYDIIFT
ncbi:MAG: hypothetical protein PHI05_04920, partial [Bacilli bacterium]|nr:hypothetical protein [Bacilli bacterium]